MESIRNQRTLASTAALDGVGYWSGQDVRVEFRPADRDSGVVFVRGDLPGCPRIAATAANCVEASRRTVIRAGEATVEMIEHIMAALAGMQVDNCEVWVNQPEMPGVDGSALPFVAALQKAGMVQQNAPRRLVRLDRMIRLGNEESWIEARPTAQPKTTIQFELDYGSGNPIGRQSLEILLAPKFFHVNLAPARTFMLEHEATAMHARGIGLRATVRDLLIFDAQGPIGNELRFPDECVRHKILDMIGDLAMAGCDFAATFSAFRSGHRLNAELVRAILADQPADDHVQRRCA